MADATTIGPHAIAALGKALKFGRADALEILKSTPGEHGQATLFARETGLRNIPGSKSKW
jgi:hypothetical protein